MLKAGKKKGAMLFIVLATLLVVATLTNGILAFVLSHFRHTHHQVTRIQAYYAAMAGMVLASDNLRSGSWSTGTYQLCKSGCVSPNMADIDIPYNVSISISAPNATNIRTINITTNYIYTP